MNGYYYQLVCNGWFYSKKNMANRKRGADKLPTIKGYCKDCRKCTEYQGDLICEGVVIGIIVIKDSGYVERNDYCSCFEPKKEKTK